MHEARKNIFLVLYSKVTPTCEIYLSRFFQVKLAEKYLQPLSTPKLISPAEMQDHMDKIEKLHRGEGVGK